MKGVMQEYNRDGELLEEEGRRGHSEVVGLVRIFQTVSYYSEAKTREGSCSSGTENVPCLFNAFTGRKQNQAQKSVNKKIHISLAGQLSIDSSPSPFFFFFFFRF